MTYNVGEGKLTEFSDFALQCARAFGAFIHMRDDSGSAKLRYDTDNSSYHHEELAENLKKLAFFKTASNEELNARQNSEIEENYKRNCEYYKRYLEEDNRYRAMTEKVMTWNPPTSDHNGLKDFMIEQLRISMNNPKEPIRDVPKSVDKYRDFKIKWYQNEVEYHTKEIGKQNNNVVSRNEWIDQLIISLGLNPKEVIQNAKN